MPLYMVVTQEEVPALQAVVDYQDTTVGVYEKQRVWDEVVAETPGAARSIFTRKYRLDFTEPLIIQRMYESVCEKCGESFWHTKDQGDFCTQCGHDYNVERSNESILRSFLQMLDAVNQEYDLPDTFEDAYMVGVSLEPEEWGETLAARIELTAALEAIHAYLNGEDLSQL